MRIVCQQMILMKSHTLFFSKIGKDVEICPLLQLRFILRVKLTFNEIFNSVMFLFMSKICLLFTVAAAN